MIIRFVVSSRSPSVTHFTLPGPHTNIVWWGPIQITENSRKSPEIRASGRPPRVTHITTDRKIRLRRPKGKQLKIDTVSMCQYIARSRVARFTRAIPQFASPASHALDAKIRLSKSHHGPKLWALENIFAGLLNIGFSKYGHILGKSLCSGPRRQPGRQAHGGTTLAPRHHVRCP